MHTDLEERVRAFVARETGERIERISLKTRIAHDIGCDGIDADDLFEAFAKEFELDLSGIQWNKHFYPEGSGCPIGCLVFLFGWTVRSNKFVTGLFSGDELAPVTVGDLVEAAQAKRWVKNYSEKG